MKYRTSIFAGSMDFPEGHCAPVVFISEFDSKDDAYDAVTKYFEAEDIIQKIKESYRADIFTVMIEVFNHSTNSWSPISKAIEIP